MGFKGEGFEGGVSKGGFFFWGRRGFQKGGGLKGWVLKVEVL